MRAIASASPTDVPPNLRTITRHRGSKPQCTISSAFSTDAPGGAAHDVVPHRDELDVEERIGDARDRP